MVFLILEFEEPADLERIKRFAHFRHHNRRGIISTTTFLTLEALRAALLEMK